MTGPVRVRVNDKMRGFDENKIIEFLADMSHNPLWN